jgi:hypothetical protein
MDAELKAKWVAALRSGEYRQGKHMLRDGDRYCCLGVLCSINGMGFHGDAGSYLGPRQSSRVGLDRETQTELANMNDLGVPFPAIADHIEANL